MKLDSSSKLMEQGLLILSVDFNINIVLSLSINIFKTCIFIVFAFCTGTLFCALLIFVDLRHGVESSLYH
jgi:hypothetical protein